MLRLLVRKTVRGGAAAACVLLASIVLAPSQAEASCGDYVTIGGQHSQTAHSGAVDQDMPGQHDPAKPRCHGPSCSNRSFPPAAPATRVEVTVEHWALPGGSAQSQSPQATSLIAETREVLCAGF